MRRWIIVMLGLIVVACGTPLAQLPPSDVRFEADATPQAAIGDRTAVAAGDAPMDATNEPLPTPQGPTATNTVPATLIATPIDYVEYVRPMRFMDETHGWMWNRSSVFTTTDGGERWREEWSVPFVTLQYILHGDFVSMQQGWVAVSRAMSTTNTTSLFATQDSGATWHELPLDPKFDVVNWIDFVDAEHGWIVVHAPEPLSFVHVLRTTDGGKTWTQVAAPCPPSTLGDTHPISFSSRTKGWALCTTWDGYVSSTQLFATTDGGQHWQERGLPPAPPAPPSPSMHPHTSDPSLLAPPTAPPPPAPIFFLDELHGWIGGQHGDVFMTTDGGQIWQHITVTSQDTSPVYDIQFWSASQGVVVMNGALLRTNDAGATWQRDLPQLHPSRVQFFDPHNGIGAMYFVEEAVLLRTADGGRSWIMAGELTPECYDGQTLHFVDQMHGWSLGRAQGVSEAPPILCRTTDGDQTWTQMPALDAAGAAAISFLDANTGYLSSTGSPWTMLTPQLQTTQDGGATFVAVSDVPLTAHQIEFVSPNVGWKLADWQLSATTDGGVAWTPIPLGHRVLFFDLLSGGYAWVLTEDCSADACERRVLSTSDNGATWTNHVFDATWATPLAPGKPDPIASPEPGYPPYAQGVLQQSTAIIFVDPQHGWLVQAEYHLRNNQRQLWATADGGRTWTMLP